MTKRLAPVALALVFLFAPFASHADSYSSIEAQIQALLSQVATQQPAVNTTVPESATTNSVCVNITHTLSLYATDANTSGDVSRLQQFLASLGTSIYPQALVTGYFGPVTEQAVQRWQTAHRIVSSGSPSTTGYGNVGLRTQSAMRCGMTSTTSTTNTANNTSIGTHVVNTINTTNTNTTTNIQSTTVATSNSAPTTITTPAPVVTTNANSNVNTLQPSGTINAGQITVSGDYLTVSGTATNVSSVTLTVAGYTGGSATVVNGSWSITLGSVLPPGTYVLHLYDTDGNAQLALGTITTS